MARTAPLIPTLIKTRKAQGKAPWCLSIPPHLSSTGSRQRLFYPTKTAALLDANALTARRDNFGVSLSTMTPARIASESPTNWRATPPVKSRDFWIPLLALSRGKGASFPIRSKTVQRFTSANFLSICQALFPSKRTHWSNDSPRSVLRLCGLSYHQRSRLGTLLPMWRKWYPVFP
jgi:hypothetical protein